ncbi:MAG: YtxH domain-containing protein [Phototrophicaceae bacterium]|jgi:gas vesicle protein
MNHDRNYFNHDEDTHTTVETAGLMVLSLIVGLGIGTLVLLVAPASGKRTRRNIAHNVEEGLHSGRESAEQLMKRLEGEFADLRKSIDERVKQS